MTRLSLPSLALLAGCGFSPVSGLYRFTQETATDDCEMMSDTGDTGDVQEAVDQRVTIGEDGTTMTLGEGEDALTCTLQGRDFTCEMPPFSMDMTGYGIDAKVDMVSTTEGEWTSDTSFDATTTMTMTCTGADCAANGLESCTSTFSGYAELVEE